MQRSIEDRTNRAVFYLAMAFMVCALTICFGAFLRGCDDGGHIRPVFAQSVQPAAVEVHYSPAEDLEAIDVAQLDAAKKTVDISSYAMDDRPIAEELVKLAQRGVVVRIYRDQTQYAGERAHGARGGSDLNALFAGQPNIHVRIKGVLALAHLKAYAVDGTLLREGSANWSASGEKVQDNSLLVVREPAAVERFESNFEAIWNRPSNQAVQ